MNGKANNVEKVMKRYLRIMGALTVACLIMQAGNASAGSVTFYDNAGPNANAQTINFPGYSGASNPAYQGDTYLSLPDIATITVTWNDAGVLQTIQVTSTTPLIYWDSLMIATDFTGTVANNLAMNPSTPSMDNKSYWDWDYLIHVGSMGNGITANGDPNGYANGSVPGNGVYAVADNYNYTTVNNTGRIGEINGIANDGALTQLSSGVNTPQLTSTSVTYDLSSLGINLGTAFAIAYSPYCANDVVLAAAYTGVVPEPATLVLFGLGTVALAGWRIRQQRAKK